MKRMQHVYLKVIFSALVIIAFAPDAWCLSGNGIAADTLTFYDGRQFTVIGRFHNEENYRRFPQRYKGVLRDQVWEESLSSAGIAIRFRTNATLIAVRWSLREIDPLSKEAGSIGTDGVDLYCNTAAGWQYVNTGKPKHKENQFILLRNGDGGYKEYLLNLPLYNGVDSLSIGVNGTADISKPVEKYLIEKKPVIYYGSSIAQGAAASRPGMAFTNILSRKLDIPFINFGFSGEGKFDLSVASAMSEVDASLYIIDCTPNSKKEIICDSAIKVVRLLKEKRPLIPVLLVEGFYYEDSYFNKDGLANIDDKRKELRKAFELLKESGIKGLYYKKGDGLIGYDHEGTADGVHPNDVGMLRFSEQMLPVIESVLKKKISKND
ncbi:SGNH/GDSL hydrolase family protein [Mucilaginibacter sp. BT774]|uniref:SGNH/GDSL hydrolase family protein n=1 Tax=Mucilaginibacter sp. BT774 TaxID=3062276 RepID=UPI002674A17F|nr:SGNH/GDSL hydrolase family protein [Mucilaginibacter sp. BT774]MDO3628365.1 SGNH/GDSL hydrolase family protein [Mucilaginibacter sp. BT774]